MPKPQTNIRLSPEGRAILDALAKSWGIGTSAVVELLLRKQAKAEKLLPTKRRAR